MFDTSTPTGVGLLLGMSALQFGLGSACGWWLHGPGKPLPPDTTELDELVAQQKKKAQEMDDAMKRLRDLTGDIGLNVGQHANVVETIGKELATAESNGDEALQATLVSAVSRVTEANEMLQNQLREAEQRLAEQAKALETQMAQARTDALTGILNRRAFDDELARRVAEFQRYRTPVTLLLGDIDYFKKFNDSHGHQAGDAVLKGVAQALTKAMRDVDLVCRYGGEEFAVIMPATELPGGGMAAERARAAIEKLKLEFEGKTFQVTMSSGVATATPGEDPAAIIRRADEALYASKKAGRNCSHYHDLTQSLPVAEMNKQPTPAEKPPVETKPAAENATKNVDPLQLLPNRHAMLDELTKRIDQHRRFRTPMTLALMSVDHLGPIVANYGADATSLVLRAAVQFFNSARRENDMLARVADNRLALIAPGVDDFKLAQSLERVRSAIEKCQVPAANGDEITFTISMGLAEVQADDTADALMARTTLVLDAATLGGGNRVQLGAGRFSAEVEPAATPDPQTV